MKPAFKLLLKDNLNSSLIKVFVLMLILSFGVIIWKWPLLPPQLPLFYSLPRGADQLVTPPTLLLLPFFSLFVFIFNLILAIKFITKEKLAAKMLITISTMVAFLFLVTLFRIIFLVS